MMGVQCVQYIEIDKVAEQVVVQQVPIAARRSLKERAIARYETIKCTAGGSLEYLDNVRGHVRSSHSLSVPSQHWFFCPMQLNSSYPAKLSLFVVSAGRHTWNSVLAGWGIGEVRNVPELSYWAGSHPRRTLAYPETIKIAGIDHLFLLCLYVNLFRVLWPYQHLSRVVLLVEVCYLRRELS